MRGLNRTVCVSWNRDESITCPTFTCQEKREKKKAIFSSPTLWLLKCFLWRSRGQSFVCSTVLGEKAASRFWSTFLRCLPSIPPLRRWECCPSLRASACHRQNMTFSDLPHGHLDRGLAAASATGRPTGALWVCHGANWAADPQWATESLWTTLASKSRATSSGTIDRFKDSDEVELALEWLILYVAGPIPSLAYILALCLYGEPCSSSSTHSKSGSSINITHNQHL